MSTGEMTLGEAARFSGVSQTTVRGWVHKIEGARKLEHGGYSIPKNGLMTFLATRAKGGSSRSGAIALTSGEGTSLQTRGEDHLQAEVEYLRDELREAKAELKDVRAELKESQTEVRKLEAELRAHLSGGIGKTLSRWFKG